MSDLNIEVKYAPLCRPQSMGMLERTHGPIKSALKASLLENGELYTFAYTSFITYPTNMKSSKLGRPYRFGIQL